MYRRSFSTTMWLLALAAVFVIASSPRLRAQSEPESHFTFNVGGGFTPFTGSSSQRFRTGWNAGAGAGWRVSSPFSLGVQFNYNSFGLTRSFINAAGTPGGDGHLWDVTLQPTIRLTTVHSVQPYLVGGVGLYHRTVHFTRPALQNVVLFDPFFGFFPGSVPTNLILRTSTSNAIGGNAGFGLSFGVPKSSSARFFMEARYHYAATRMPTRLIPVTFGVMF